MVNFTQLLALAGIASAVHIDFKRYAVDNCDPGHHIRKTSDLHDTHCKTFSKHELGFHSFDYKVTSEHGDVNGKDCYVVVFPEEKCHGQGITYGNMQGLESACGKVPFEGRSVRVQCDKKVDPQVKLLSPRPSPSTTSATKTVTNKPTVTVTHTHEAERLTMTVVPKPADRVKVCHYEDQDDDEQ